MSYPIAVGIPLSNDREKSIDRARQGIADTAAMCSALGVFLAAAFPHAVEQASNFEHWLERYLNHNQKEYLEQLQTAPPDRGRGIDFGFNVDVAGLHGVFGADWKPAVLIEKVLDCLQAHFAMLSGRSSKRHGPLVLGFTGGK